MSFSGVGMLGALAVVDGAFAGFRAAAGRSGLLDKRTWYREAMARGAAYGAFAALAMAALLVALAPADAEVAARRALAVYLPYAAVLALAGIARRVEHVDVRSIASLLVFGPFTLLRPLVLIAGILAAAIPGSRAVALLGVAAILLMNAVEIALDRHYARRAA